MLTYSKAQEMMERARHGRRKLENNTWLERRAGRRPDGGRPLEDDFAVRLHNTDVVTFHPDGSVTLDSGGWRTMTTKSRINGYLPVGARVESDAGEWFLYPRWNGWGTATAPGSAYPFADGMRLLADGTVEGASMDLRPIRRQVLKMVRAYVNGYAAHVVKNGLQEPSSGDCWGCFMRLSNDPAKIGPWGQTQRPLAPGRDMMTGVDHLLSHFEEKYYVPSLFWRAVQRRGNPAFCWQVALKSAGHGDTRMLKGDLRAFFKPLMPALVEEVARRQAVAKEEAA